MSSCREKYFKEFKPAIAHMVTRLEFRLCAGGGGTCSVLPSN